LLYAGRLEQGQKRVLDLLTLAQVLAARGVPFRLRIVGDGPDRAALCARAPALGATGEHVSVETGVPPDRVPELLRAADVCLLVSAYEGTSLFMLEGMAHGCVPVGRAAARPSPRLPPTARGRPRSP
jgi:glycosyltransferase involved in cell wall biosynthesis